jgi:hypothetical protein
MRERDTATDRWRASEPNSRKQTSILSKHT